MDRPGDQDADRWQRRPSQSPVPIKDIPRPSTLPPDARQQSKVITQGSKMVLRHMTPLVALLGMVAIAILGLFVWRWNDARIDEETWQALADLSQTSPLVFDEKMVAGLPESAQRYFRYMIMPGTPLQAVVEIEMGGELGLGTKEAPNYKSMQARQILALPHGFVWRLKSGGIVGADGAARGTSWTRFWLFGLIPVVRAGGDADHLRSAMGRLVAEAVFWSPAALLPGDNVHWEWAGLNTARVIVHVGAFDHVVDVTVAEDGRPTRVILQRWSNENHEKIYRLQPFGGDLSRFRRFGGYRLPTRVEGGNLIGTEAYFPFYKAEVTAIRFVQGPTQP